MGVLYGRCMRAGTCAFAALALLVACPGSGSKKQPDAPHATTLTIFGLAEMRGQIEPCGCTTDPLGDLARTAGLIAEARAAGPTLVVDAGGLLYTRNPVPDYLVPQETLKSDLLVKAYAEDLKVAAIGLGAVDLAMGAKQVRPARMASNVALGIERETRSVIDAGGVPVGVFGVVSAEHAPGLTVEDPQVAAARSVTTLREGKPRLIVALLTMSKKDAVKLLEATPGIDIAILGMGLESPEPDRVRPRAEQRGTAWLVIPGNRGQVVPRITVTLRDGDAPLVDAVGPAAAAELGVELDERIAAAKQELAGFEADPTADPAFVGQKRQELAGLEAERADLTAHPLRVPESGSYFTLEQIRIQKGLACDANVQAAKQAYAAAAGKANVEAAAGHGPLPPDQGKAGYVGVEECDVCHSEAVAFWKTTKHFEAWETLEKVSKQFDYECIGCHVSGWDKPGGATMGQNELLRDVQCETCHGPGSIHAEAETKATIVRNPDKDLCAGQCHTKEHSDTFDLEAYLRDVVGPGHGEERRKALGDGPTGHELRAAGLAKASQTLGAGCVK